MRRYLNHQSKTSPKTVALPIAFAAPRPISFLILIICALAATYLYLVIGSIGNVAESKRLHALIRKEIEKKQEIELAYTKISGEINLDSAQKRGLTILVPVEPVKNKSNLSYNEER